MKRAHLAHNPLCERCKVQGKVTAATVVHHKKKHEGNEILFFDPANLASSCAPCHDSIEQQIEKRGYSMAIGADGWPIDPNHPSNG
jgi:5-methylcytosine-specific restriction endonuclease McrA